MTDFACGAAGTAGRPAALGRSARQGLRPTEPPAQKARQSRPHGACSPTSPRAYHAARPPRAQGSAVCLRHGSPPRRQGVGTRPVPKRRVGSRRPSIRWREERAERLAQGACKESSRRVTKTPHRLHAPQREIWSGGDAAAQALASSSSFGRVMDIAGHARTDNVRACRHPAIAGVANHAGPRDLRESLRAPKMDATAQAWLPAGSRVRVAQQPAWDPQLPRQAHALALPLRRDRKLLINIPNDR